MLMVPLVLKAFALPLFMYVLKALKKKKMLFKILDLYKMF